MLDSGGLVTLVANAGAWVTQLSLRECVEAYLIRERLEPLLLRMSLPLLDETAIARMGELAAAMEEATREGEGGPGGEADVDAFLRADREFHLASYAAGGGERDKADRPPAVERHPALPARVLPARGRGRRGGPERSPTWSTGCWWTAPAAATPTTASGCS